MIENFNLIMYIECALVETINTARAVCEKHEKNTLRFYQFLSCTKNNYINFTAIAVKN